QPVERQLVERDPSAPGAGQSTGVPQLFDGVSPAHEHHPRALSSGPSLNVPSRGDRRRRHAAHRLERMNADRHPQHHHRDCRRRAGTTGLIEIGFDVPSYAAVIARSGLRLVLAQSCSDVVADAVATSAMFSPARADASLQRVAETVERWHGAEGGRITCCVAAHAPEACSPALLRAARTLAESRRLRYTIHLCQSRWEVEQVMHQRGVRPTEYLSQNEFLGPDLIAAHCRFMTPSEVSLLGQSRAFVSHNAAMAARRAAAPPIQALAAAGCTIAMGSDNMAEDMVEVMRTGLFMERVARQDAQSPQPEDVLEWAARNGANALGHGQIAGSLEVGK